MMYAQGGTLEGTGVVIDKDGNIKAEFTVKSDPLTDQQTKTLNEMEKDHGNHS
jgi:hypothetical protein